MTTGGAGAPDRTWLVPAARAIAVRPALWGTAVRQALALAEPGWWRRQPHLPLPPAAYLRFRLATAYGDPDATPEPVDLVTYLSWCRAERRRRSGARARTAPLSVKAGR